MLDFFRYGSDQSFVLFSFTHLIVLITFVIFGLLMYSFRKKLRQPHWNYTIRYGLITILVVSEVAIHAWSIYWGVWNIEENLPLQLCTISLILSIIMLLTNSYLLTEITYFIGIGGALQALLTPELFYGFPHFRFFHFFIAHIAIILASLFMVFVQQYRPTIKSIGKTFLALNVVVIFVLIINTITGANYMFLSRKPTNPSLIDFLGPYPWYIVSLEFVALIMFFILYIPIALEKGIKKKKNFGGVK